MAKITIEGIPPWDGDYEFDYSTFTNRELHEIKKVSGLRALELGDGIMNGDISALIGIAVVVLAQKGLTVDPDDFWDAEVGKLRFDFSDEEEAGADGPPSGTPPEQEPEPSEGGGEITPSSGDGSEQPGDQSPRGPSRIGELGLEEDAA